LLRAFLILAVDGGKLSGSSLFRLTSGERAPLPLRQGDRWGLRSGLEVVEARTIPCLESAFSSPVALLATSRYTE
jgi:hypothetical protein